MVKRKQQEVNINSLANARFYSAFFNGFGGENSSVSPAEFLPYQLQDDNSPKARLRKAIGSGTIAIARRLIDDEVMPPEVIATLYNVEGMVELLEESSK